MTLEDGWNIIYKNGKIDSAIVVENGRIDGDPEESWTRYGYTFDPAVVITKAEYDALVANQAAPPAMTEEIAETIRSELEAERANLVDYQDNWKKSSSTYKQYAARIAQLDAALAWLSAQKETADGN